MKILLINPWNREIYPPPSLGYIQSSIKTLSGVDVVAKDIDSVFQDNTEYDLVAVTFHSFSVKYAKRIRDKFKCRLVCGGHHPSALPQQMLDAGYDQVCIGEGEDVIKEIISGNTEKIIKGYVKDIESLPFPDYTGLQPDPVTEIAVISSRGCPFKCGFCASSLFWGRKWKIRSAENVLEELKYIISKGIKTWMFDDDNFTTDKDRVYKICEGISKIRDDIDWQCTSRAETLNDRKFIKALYNAGCRVIWVGVESLSQESIERCGKDTKVEDMINGIKIATEENMKTVSMFISGIPGDTLSNIKETVDKIKKYKIRRKNVQIMWILPDTDVYLLAKEKGFDDSIYLESGAPCYTYEQDINTLSLWSEMIWYA